MLARNAPVAPAARTEEAAQACSGAELPMVDLGVTLLGVAAGYAAERDEEDQNAFFAGSDQHSPPNDYKTPRIAGYATAAVFGASAVYGFIAAARCANLRSEVQKARAKQPKPDTTPQRRALPEAVAGFRFGMSPEQAEQACAAQARSWRLDDGAADCGPSGSQPNVHLVFRAESVARIAIAYIPSADALTADYEHLADTLRASYGPPQDPAAPLPAQCSAGLVECLKSGAVVEGPAWHLPTGSITLEPRWSDEHLLVELRYSRR